MNAALQKPKKMRAPEFTRAERERVEQIVSMWIEYVDSVELIERIAQEGPGMLEMRNSVSSGYKPDVMAKKMEELRQHYLSDDLVQAKEMIYSLPVYEREYVTAWPQLKRTRNPRTGENFTLKEVRLYFGCCEKTYKTRVTAAKRKLIDIDKKFNPRLYVNSNS